MHHEDPLSPLLPKHPSVMLIDEREPNGGVKIYGQKRRLVCHMFSFLYHGCCRKRL